MANFIVITHGEKVPELGNPALSAKGKKQIEKILEANILRARSQASVVCGTGNRHLETARILHLLPTAYSPLAGCPDSSDVYDGKKVALLAGHQIVPIGKWLIPDTKHFLFSLEHGTIIIAGRPFMLGLGYKEAKEGMVFNVETEKNNTLHDSLVFIEVIYKSDGNLDIH